MKVIIGLLIILHYVVICNLIILIAF